MTGYDLKSENDLQTLVVMEIEDRLKKQTLA